MIPDELRHAFPEPDERFQACVRRTLDALAQEDAQKERLPMKRTHLRVGVLIAVAVLLLSTIGVAAASLRYGVFDFLRGADGSPAALPEASALVQTEIPQTEVTQAGAPAAETAFSLREAVYDGGAVHMVVEARPASDEVLLIGPDCLLTDPVSDLGISGEESIAEYAAANGKTEIRSVQIVDTGAATGGEGVVQSLEYRLEGDGTLVFIASGSVADGAATLPVDLVCITYPGPGRRQLRRGKRHADRPHLLPGAHGRGPGLPHLLHAGRVRRLRRDGGARDAHRLAHGNLLHPGVRRDGMKRPLPPRRRGCSSASWTRTARRSPLRPPSAPR